MLRRTFVRLVMLGVAGLGIKLSAQTLPKPKGVIHGTMTIGKPPMILTLSKVVGFKYELKPDPRVFEVVSQLIRANQVRFGDNNKPIPQDWAFNGLTPGVYRIKVGDRSIQGFEYIIDDLEITPDHSSINVEILHTAPYPVTTWIHDAQP